MAAETVEGLFYQFYSATELWQIRIGVKQEDEYI